MTKSLMPKMAEIREALALPMSRRKTQLGGISERAMYPLLDACAEQGLDCQYIPGAGGERSVGFNLRSADGDIVNYDAIVSKNNRIGGVAVRSLYNRPLNTPDLCGYVAAQQINVLMGHCDHAVTGFVGIFPKTAAQRLLKTLNLTHGVSTIILPLAADYEERLSAGARTWKSLIDHKFTEIWMNGVSERPGLKSRAGVLTHQESIQDVAAGLQQRLC